jgi:small subunit ribosomal protein S6
MAVERQTEYETVYIMRPGADEDETTKARERFEGIIENAGGHVLRFDDWGVRKLAYAIKVRAENASHKTGNYFYYRYLAPTDTVAELERNLRILDPVMKYLTVKLEADLVPEDRLKNPTEAESLDVTSSEEE